VIPCLGFGFKVFFLSKATNLKHGFGYIPQRARWTHTLDGSGWQIIADWRCTWRTVCTFVHGPRRAARAARGHHTSNTGAPRDGTESSENIHRVTCLFLGLDRRRAPPGRGGGWDAGEPTRHTFDLEFARSVTSSS
jgi:hypothetical protein